MWSFNFLPWHDQLAHQWLARREQFAHAWLIHGMAGLGKTQLAESIAAALLCEMPVKSGFACQQCSACTWVAQYSHPDLRLIRPDALAALDKDFSTRNLDELEDKNTINHASEAQSKNKPLSQEIRIDQIRDLQSFVSIATHRAGQRVILLYPAESLNITAANALLKMLEEPPIHTVFLLISDSFDKVLPTIVSRCQRLAVHPPPTNLALDWLAHELNDGDQKGSYSEQEILAHWNFSGGAPVIAKERLLMKCPVYSRFLLNLLEEFAEHRVNQWITTRNTQFLSMAWMLKASEQLALEFDKTGTSRHSTDPSPVDWQLLEWIDELQRLLLDLALALKGQALRYFPSLKLSINCLVGYLIKKNNISNGTDSSEIINSCLRDILKISSYLTQQRQIAKHPLNNKLFIYEILSELKTILA